MEPARERTELAQLLRLGLGLHVRRFQVVPAPAGVMRCRWGRGGHSGGRVRIRGGWRCRCGDLQVGVVLVDRCRRGGVFLTAPESRESVHPGRGTGVVRAVGGVEVRAKGGRGKQLPARCLSQMTMRRLGQ